MYHKEYQVIGDIPVYYLSEFRCLGASGFKLDQNKGQLSRAGVHLTISAQQSSGVTFINGWHMARGFSLVEKRIAHNLAMFDLVRIDHFKGLVSYRRYGPRKDSC